jgi:hypothetical protein
MWGQLSSCFFSTGLHLAALPSLPFWEHLRSSLHTCHTFQSPESPKHTFSHTKGSLQPDGLPLHIWRVLTLVSGTQHSPSSVSTMLGPEWFIKPYTKAYNTPSNGNFYFQVRQSLSEYLNMITSSPLFQESTHPGVASALCSTLGTTPYFSVSLPLLVSRVQVAFHLYLWGQPIKGWSIYVLILWVLQCLHRAHHLDKSQLVPGTCACPLLIPSSRVLMLHKSPTYCPRQMSSSSLIFSMGAISMKVNPTFVFILIIATSLAIHLSTYI